MNPIYLEYNATTPLVPAVIEAMLPYIQRHFGNPSSTHSVRIGHDVSMPVRKEQQP